MKILSYNINGIRAAFKKGLVPWLQTVAPDVVCLQEIKAKPEQWDATPLENLGYTVHQFPAQKPGYSGVAILSKIPGEIERGIGVDYADTEGRVLTLHTEGLSVVSAYFPSGTTPGRQAVKLQFLNDFYAFAEGKIAEAKPMIITGDYNICHTPLDIHDPLRLDGVPGFTPEERDWMSRFMALGFFDAFRAYNPHPENYTWWSYMARARERNKGWRIDYHLASESLKEKLLRTHHLTQAHHSDHCAVLSEWGV